MSKYKSYKDRIGASGSTMQEALQSSTKRQNHSFILNSPSKSNVMLNEEVETRPCIVSNKESFNKRLFLFLPETIVKVGDYIHHDTFTYLATDANRNDLYPELTGELCNEVFKVKGASSKVKVGTDSFGRPIYETIAEEHELPCVMTTKTYSTADNSAIPLPEGAMIVKIPYIEDIAPKQNDEFKIWGEDYQITDVSYINVINGVGYVEIRLAREVDNI